MSANLKKTDMTTLISSKVDFWTRETVKNSAGANSEKGFTFLNVCVSLRTVSKGKICWIERRNIQIWVSLMLGQESQEFFVFCLLLYTHD